MCTPKLCAFVAIAVVATALADVGGSTTGTHSNGSLRGALRALERRRRAPLSSLPLAALQYPDTIEYMSAKQNYQSGYPSQKENLLSNVVFAEPIEEYKSAERVPIFRERVSSFKSHNKIFEKKRSSPFRERSEKEKYEDNLKNVFRNELIRDEDSQIQNDAKYEYLLEELWNKFKNNQDEQRFGELVKTKQLRIVKKRQIPGDYTPTGWGPIAFKKKRSSQQRVDDGDNPNDFLYSLKFLSHNDPTAIENLKDERISNDDDDPDISRIINVDRVMTNYPVREDTMENILLPNDEYNPFQQVESGIEDMSPDDDELIYEKEKRFPVTKRSNFSPKLRGKFSKRNTQHGKLLMFITSGTDPKVAKELSNIFGDQSSLKNTHQKPVKRSSSNLGEDISHEAMPPAVTVLSHHGHNDSKGHDHHNDTQNHNHTLSRHEHESKPPLLSADHEHSHEEETRKTANIGDEENSHLNIEHPIILKKKSIDWSNYFGIDKRKKKSVVVKVNPLPQLYKTKVKRYINRYSFKDIADDSKNEKRISKQDTIKLEKMDNRFKNMEQAMVNEALSMLGPEDNFDTKEEQATKEQILSRLASAYSAEKMRKALLELKMSMEAQHETTKEPLVVYDEEKKKRRDVQEKSDNIPFESTIGQSNPIDDIDFEGEQGAGQFLDGTILPISEGEMGGSGMKAVPKQIEEIDASSCPVLERIVRRCHGVDFLAGDHGQLFLPLCSLHQICYICGPSTPTGCDLIFLSEADSLCGKRASCQQAARSTVMALRDLHDSYEDELEGQCGDRSCLADVLRSNAEWMNDFKR